MKKTTEEQSIVPVIEKQASPILRRIGALHVTDESSKREASALLNDLKAFQDRVVDYKETKTKPLNTLLKIIRDETRELEGNLKTALDSTRAKLNAYQTEQLRLARIEEDKIAARVKEGRGNLTPETATKKIAELDKPSLSVDTGNGAVKFRTVKKLVIDDKGEICLYVSRNALWSMVEVDEKVLKSMLIDGVIIPGAHIEEVQEAASYL